MARPTIEQIRDIKIQEFATTFRWDLYLPPPGGIGSSDDINIRCESAEIPVKLGQLIDLTMRGFKISVNGIWNNSQDLTIQCVESVDSKISSILKDWTELCWDFKDSSSKDSSDIKVNGYLNRLDSNDVPVWKYDLKGVMVQSYSMNSLGSDSELLRPTIILRYDYFKEGAV